MKKTVLLSLLLLSGYTVCRAQSFTASNIPPPIVHPNPFQVVSASVTINNISASSKYVKVERMVNILAPGHTSYFCWGVCYAPATSMSDSLLMTAGSSTDTFYTDIDPNGVAGQDTGCYRFFDMYNAADNVEVCFYFDVTTGVYTVNSFQTNPLSVASPNPANTLSGINYYTDVTKNPRLVIYNLLGTKVFEAKLVQKQGAYIINVADFKQGIYLYSLIENGKTVATQKLVVAHK